MMDSEGVAVSEMRRASVREEGTSSLMEEAVFLAGSGGGV
jgi:hypothetical protein